jgi:hypothetical protein
VSNGAKVNLRDTTGLSATYYAFDKGEIEIYNYLKQHGALDFEAKPVIAVPVPTSAPASTPAPVATQPAYTPPPSSSNSSRQPSTAEKIVNTLNNAVRSMHTVTVYYMENGTKKVPQLLKQHHQKLKLKEKLSGNGNH